MTGAIVTAALAACPIAACGTGTESTPLAGGEAERGHELIVDFGCATCHTIGGDEANDAIEWIMDPRDIDPGTIMPGLGVSREQAADIVTYLYGP